MLYAIINSKFHGGGILYQTSSPRELLRATRWAMDGCFDGRGCQGYAASMDDGDTWYRIDIGQYVIGSAGCTHHYADMSIYAEPWDMIPEWEQILPAKDTIRATALAL